VLFLVEPSWTYQDGVMYVVSAICGLGTPLTNKVTGHGAFGKLIAAVIGTWCLTIIGTIVGVADLPELQHSLDRLEHHVSRLCCRSSRPGLGRRRAPGKFHKFETLPV